MADHRAAKYPPWAIITAAALAAVVIASLVVVVLAGYRTGEIVAFIGEVAAAIVAAVLLFRRALARKDEPNV